MALQVNETEQNTVTTVSADQLTVERRKRLQRLARLSWAGAIAFLAVLAIVVILYQYRELNVIRSGVYVFGVDVGGMTRAEAIATLDHVRNARSNERLTIVDGEREWTLNHGQLGFQMDIENAVDDAFRVGRTGFGPSRIALLWHFKDNPHRVGAEYVAVASDRLDAELTVVSDQIYQERADPDLQVFSDATFTYQHAQTGRSVDAEASKREILSALSTGEPTVELIVVEDVPEMSDNDYETVLNQLSNLFDAPIVVEVNGETWTFTPDILFNWIQVELPSDGTAARLTVNETWIDDVVNEIALFINRQPQSVRIWWNESGALQVVRDGSPGYHLQWDESRASLGDAFHGISDSNEIALPFDSVLPPEIPEDLGALGLNSVIAESQTSYVGSIEPRKHNIELAARLLNGTLVMPGQLFSFNSEIGPMTIDAGFQVAYGIAADEGQLRTVPAEAGGICQVATTVFQPVFISGYQIEQRSTHSYWIESYAYQGYVGLDATVDSEFGLDFKWTNNSDFPVLIQAEATGEDFIVRLIGQRPNWSVEVLKPEISSVKEAEHEKTYYEADASIEPGKLISIEHAQDGFDVKIVRIVHDSGEDRVFEVTTTYGVARNVVLVGSEDGTLPPEFR